MSRELTLAHQGADVSIGILGSVVLVVWRNQMTSADARQQNRILDEQLRIHAQIGVLPFIEESVTVPGEEVRRVLSEASAKHGGALVGVALTVDGEGFRAAVVRGVTTAVNLLSHQSSPTRAFATTEEATGWLLGRFDRRAPSLPTVAEVAAAMQALRRGAKEGARTSRSPG